MKYNLSDVCSRLSSGKNIKASEISSEGEYPVFGGNGQRGFTNHFNFDGECAIIGRQGAFCGNVRYFAGKGYMTEHAVVVCGNDKSNIRYLAYLLSRMQLGRLSGQSAQPGLSVKVLAQQEIELPSIEYQNKIASILDSIEAKIFLNTAINDNLADIIQSVYQNRFSSTRSDVTAGVLADICSYSKDKVPVLDLNNSNYYSTENMQSDKKGAVDAATLPTIAQTTKCRKGDVLISNIRPYFKKIVYCQFDCGCSTDVLCFCPKESALSAFLFSTLYADHFFDFMAAGAKGTKMPRGDKQQIMTYPIYLPSADELAKFNSIAIPALTQMECSRLENTRLTALRDALLPKLMSGELDVSAIEL